MAIDIGWLVASVFLVLASALSAQLKRIAMRRSMTIAFYLALALWIISTMGLKAFRGSETSLVGYFVLGLAILAAGEVLAARAPKLAVWSRAAVPAAGLAFAVGLDIFRPDAYSYVPAAIVGSLVLVVGLAAFRRLSQVQRPKSKVGARRRTSDVGPGLAVYIFCIMVLVYSATFKMIDRGWTLPWAYAASAGALLFASSQVWLGWEAILKEKRTPAWVREAVMNLGVLLMVGAALFVYRAFL